MPEHPTLNCIDLFLRYSKEQPLRPAIRMPNGHVTSFGDLELAAAKAQQLLLSNGIKPGDGVLVFAPLSPLVYAAIIAILGLGGHVVFVEPWMPLNLIGRAVGLIQPKLFLTNMLGMAWGCRSKAIRDIPKWMRIGKINGQRGRPRLTAEAVAPDTAAIVTFTSGSTGLPKGVMRTQNFLLRQHSALSRLLHLDEYTGGDLCPFANFTLANLASGRCSLLVPDRWETRFFRNLENLPKELLPQTVSCGPAFLKRLIDTEPKIPLTSIHVGGALTDCDLFEEGFALWPGANWLHVYGSSEAEPVAASEARAAVAASKGEGFFQTLFLGQPVPEIKARFDNSNLWVSGSHVSTFYIGDAISNNLYKSQDDEGNIWHNMDDRIIVSETGWWYGGRNKQRIDEFYLEQKIYSYLQNSDCFVYRAADGALHLFGDNVRVHTAALMKQFPELVGVHDLIVYRDKRHRARLDRETSVKKGASWIVG